MVLAIALCLALQEELANVTVETKDGNSVAGTMEVKDIRLESSLGVVTLKLKDIGSIKIVDGVATVPLKDGSTVRGKILVETWKVASTLGELTIKTSDIAAIQLRGFSQRIELPHKPLKSTALGFSVNAILASRDGKTLYLSATNGRLATVSLASLQIDKEVALGRGDRRASIALSPSGRVFVATGRLIAAVSAEEGKVLKTFEIESPIEDLYVPDDETLVVAAAPGFALVSMSKQAVVEKFGHGQVGRFLAAPSLGKLITRYSLLLLPDAARGRKEFQWGTPVRFAQDDLAGVIDADARFIATRTGRVYRVGKSIAGDLVELTTIERHESAIVLPRSKRLIAFTNEGFVKEYSTSTWELLKSWRLGVVVWHVHADEEGGVFTAVTTATGSYAPVSLHQFELPK